MIIAVAKSTQIWTHPRWGRPSINAGLGPKYVPFTGTAHIWEVAGGSNVDKGTWLSKGRLKLRSLSELICV
jgi:hypothetical protein